MPDAPKKKMPTTRAFLMLGTASFFSIFILIFSTLTFTFPVMVGVATTMAVVTISETELLKTAGIVAGSAVVAVEAFTGIGATAIDTAGEMVAAALSIVAWFLFYIWFFVSGIKLIDVEHSTHHFFISSISFIAGLIPFVNIIPTVLIGVTLIILRIRKEDSDAQKKYEASVQETLVAYAS